MSKANRVRPLNYQFEEYWGRFIFGIEGQNRKYKGTLHGFAAIEESLFNRCFFLGATVQLNYAFGLCVRKFLPISLCFLKI